MRDERCVFNIDKIPFEIRSIFRTGSSASKTASEFHLTNNNTRGQNRLFFFDQKKKRKKKKETFPELVSSVHGMMRARARWHRPKNYLLFRFFPIQSRRRIMRARINDEKAGLICR